MIEVGLYNNIKLDCSIYDEYGYTIYIYIYRIYRIR